MAHPSEDEVRERTETDPSEQGRPANEPDGHPRPLRRPGDGGEPARQRGQPQEGDASTEKRRKRSAWTAEGEATDGEQDTDASTGRRTKIAADLRGATGAVAVANLDFCDGSMSAQCGREEFNSPAVGEFA